MNEDKLNTRLEALKTKLADKRRSLEADDCLGQVHLETQSALEARHARLSREVDETVENTDAREQEVGALERDLIRFIEAIDTDADLRP